MKSPIFIVGNPRSGTTLLRLMMTCHKNIVIPPECGFAIWLSNKYGMWNVDDSCNNLKSFIADLVRCRKIEFWEIDWNRLASFLESRRPVSYAKLVSTVYEFFGKSQGHKFLRWGDKNNWYLDHILALDALYPDAMFVQVVRDARGVAGSYKRLNHNSLTSRYAPQIPCSVGESARQWQTNVDTTRNAFTKINAEHIHVVRFEDLVANPVNCLGKICEFLGEPYDSGMLDYHEVNRQNELEPAEFMPWKKKTLCPPMVAEIERYNLELTPEEIVEVERNAESGLKYYGYAIRT